MWQGRRDTLSGGLLLVLSVTLYFVIPGQVETLEGDTLTPASLPTALSVIIAGLSAILLVQGLTAPRGAAPEVAGGRLGAVYVGAVIVAIALYTALIPWLGYIAATAAVILVLSLLYGNRRWRQIVLLMALAPPAIVVFFRYTMLVLLPQGRLFG